MNTDWLENRKELRDSVCDSAGDSVWKSALNSVEYSALNSVEYSVWEATNEY